MLVNAWIAGHRTKANSVRCIVVCRRDELFRAEEQCFKDKDRPSSSLFRDCPVDDEHVRGLGKIVR